MIQLKQLNAQELSQLLPEVGDTSVDSVAISNVDSKGTLTLRCAENVLPSLIYTLVGDTGGGYSKQDARFGMVNRLPPLAHPYFPWLYCTGASSITGHAYTYAEPFATINAAGQDVTNKTLQQSTFPLFPKYREYQVKADFSQRSYTIQSDASMVNMWEQVNFYWHRNTTNVPNKNLVKCYQEWKRFCVIEYEIEGQFISAEQGQYTYLSKTALDGQVAGKANIRQLRSGAKITYNWYGVPYEWLTGPDQAVPGGVPRGFSVLDKVQGHINQSEFDGWPAGTLLYTGTKTKSIYNRPYPQITAQNIISPKRLADLQLEFVYRDPRKREEDDTQANRGALIYRGNNLVPNARDGYWYMVRYFGTETSNPLSHPTLGAMGVYPSFPFQFLFQDPAYIYNEIGGFLV